MFKGKVESIESGVEATRGNERLLVKDPFLPVDIYDCNGEIGSDWIIENMDLLYAIDLWSTNSQVIGYNGLWPSDTDNWDTILLEVIKIWADENGINGQEYEYVGSTTTDDWFWDEK